MDDSRNQEKRPGGTVEPAHRAAIARDALKRTPAGERYELRDAQAEVTYRLNTLDEMIAKADQLGVTRFTAVADNGRRTPIFKTGGTWTRPDEPAPAAALRGVVGTRTNIDIVLPIPNTAVPSLPESSAPKSVGSEERDARLAILEVALNERYLIKRAPIRIGDVTIGQTEYRYRGDTARIAFTESAFRLATDTNNPSVARSMVDVAQARNWQSIRISGNEDFKRLVWLEASLRNVRTVGYEPVPGDQKLLRKESEARKVNQVESKSRPASRTRTSTVTPTARGGGTRKTVLAALEAVLISQRVPERQREAVMVAAEQNLAERLRRGEVHKVKVYDITAPSRRAVAAPTREAQRHRERPGPSR